MFAVPVMAFIVLSIYVIEAFFGNGLPPKNHIAKRFLLSVLIGFAVQIAVITAIPGSLVVWIIDNNTKDLTYDWRVLMVNMLLYAGLSFLILTGVASEKRAKKSVS